MQIEGEAFDSDRYRASLERSRGALHVDVSYLLKKVEAGLTESTTVKLLLKLTAETAATLSTRHPDFSIFAARISLRGLYTDVQGSFVNNLVALHDHKGHGRSMPLVSADLVTLALRHRERIDSAIDHTRDEDFTYFGLETLLRAYLLRVGGSVAERPQHMFMRVALEIHRDDIDRAIETYDLMSRRFFIHATPTLFNAGTEKPQMSSCFLVAMKDDSVEGIFETLKDCALISKHAGGIGLHVSNIRATHSYIAGTNGTAAGLVPMLRVFNDMARYVDQGGNRRPGAVSITLEPWHADVFQFLELRKNHGKEEYRARDLFYALWVPDLFMRKVRDNQPWYLFSPDTAPGLSDVYGDRFDELYNEYVDQRLFTSSVPARKLWAAIIDAQIETGNPSILYKDACNAKSNQQNLGTIKSSNLCTEIIQFSDAENTAVCNLASIALSQFVTDEGEVNHPELHRVTKIVTRNLNMIIDRNYYPLPETERSNLSHRPIAIGVQGLADLYFKAHVPFDSAEARILNKAVFETIYHAALEASMELARKDGPYKSFEGSPLSRGKMQFDLWGQSPSSRYDWERLRQDITSSGVRNSLLTAVMPTASTSQILGFTECIEPVTSNIYTRRVISGEFQVVNPYLVRDLERLKLWTPDVRIQIMANNGSVQKVAQIPESLRAIYKTVWEIRQRAIIDQSVERGGFVDQSQSMNIFLESATRGKLTSMHFYGWERGLKTGLYYLRTQAASAPTPFTLEYEAVKRARSVDDDIGDSPLSPGDKRPKLQIDTPSSCDMCAS